MKDLNEMIKEIDSKIEEIKNDPSYNEDEGKTIKENAGLY